MSMTVYNIRNYICSAAIAALITGTACIPVSAAQAEVEKKAVIVGDESPAEENYTIEVSKGKLVRLSTPASAVIAADPTVADVQVVSPSLVYVNGKSVGETSILAVDSQDHEILRAVVNVTNNISKLDRAVHDIVPDAKVHFQSVDGALVMNGDVDSPLQAEDVRRLAAPFLKQNQSLINMLRPLGSNQVMLKVKIAEVNRTELKRFGISLQNISTLRDFSYGILQGRTILDPISGAFTSPGTDNTLFGNFHDGRNNINGVIDALEDNGLVTTLAEPTLTAQSGQTASFLAGGQLPIPSVTGSGSSAQVSVQYQPFGVSLSFTPTVLSKERISLTVTPEVSSISQTGSISDAGFNIPALTTRKATTSVELGSGQSFTIAGLIQNDRSNDIAKFPFLGDVPVLGALFRSSEFHNNQTELMIIVTPYIVNSVEERKALVSPTDGLVMPSDGERILLGKLYDEQPPAPDTSAPVEAIDKPRLHGPVGHVLK